MTWMLVSIGGYALLALESVISKYLLAGRIKNWQLYTFYIGLFSAFGFIFAPFGLHWQGIFPFLASMLSGLLYYLAIAFLYQSLIHSSASRIYILYGAVSTIAVVLFAKIILEETFSLRELSGIGLLLTGGVFISYKFYAKRFFTNCRKTIAAGILVGLSLVILKVGYNEQKFITGYVFSRLGISLSAIASLAIPSFRRAIFQNLKGQKKRENIINLSGSIIAKSIAGLGSLLINYSIFLGSVAVINAMISVQYVLTFIFSVLLSFYLKKIFIERFTLLNVAAKTTGIILVIAGTILIIFK